MSGCEWQIYITMQGRVAVTPSDNHELSREYISYLLNRGLNHVKKFLQIC